MARLGRGAPGGEWGACASSGRRGVNAATREATPCQERAAPARRTLISALAVLCLLVVGCARREAPVEAGVRTGTLLVGNLAEPQDLDPHTATIYTDQNIITVLFEGLTAIDERTSRPVAAAAVRWETSADGLTWIFHLRPDLRWSNGEPLTADDFVQAWRRELSPALAAETAYLLYAVKNAEAFNTGKISEAAALGFAAPDTRTVTIVLERPTPYLAVLTALPAWFPVNPRVLARHGATTQRGTAWTRPGNLVGNGPFTLEEWTPNARLAVVKSPTYWDAARTRLARVVFFPIESADVEERAFRAGQLHLTNNLPTAKIAAYRESEPEKLRLDPLLSTVFLRFNVAKPPLDHPKVRRALSLAIDRDAISRSVLSGARPPADHLVPDDCAGYTSRAHVPTDFAAARRLLAEAGFAGGQGMPAFEVQVRNDEFQPKVLEVIQAGWQRELGVRITIAPLEQKTWIQNQQSLNYTISGSSWVGDFVDPVTFLDLFSSANGNNWTNWSNANYDRWIADAARTTDGGQRYELFQQAEALLLEEAPIAPIFFGAQTYLIRPSVKGWEPSLLGLHRFQAVRLEEER
jgi:oligopeptide transport system substrate-binding protein